MGTVCFHSCALQEDTHSYRCTNYLWKYTPNRDRFATVVILFFFFTVWSFTYNFKFCILTRILPLSSRSVFQMPDFQLPQPNPPAFLTDTFNLVNTKLGSWSSPQNLSSSRTSFYPPALFSRGLNQPPGGSSPSSAKQDQFCSALLSLLVNRTCCPPGLTREHLPPSPSHNHPNTTPILILWYWWHHQGLSMVPSTVLHVLHVLT